MVGFAVVSVSLAGYGMFLFALAYLQGEPRETHRRDLPEYEQFLRLLELDLWLYCSQTCVLLQPKAQRCPEASQRGRDAVQARSQAAGQDMARQRRVEERSKVLRLVRAVEVCS